jgi:ribosomal protein S18 acetylase RimI-like enzyme
MFTGVARDAARLGSAYGALGGDGVLHGVSIWLAPGRFPWSAFRQLRGAGWMLSVLRADPSSFRAFMETGANGARLHPADQHWYLETMGVDPAVQRQGLGGRLLEPVLKIADRDGVDCYLETADPRNAEYYARHGFVVENTALQLVPDGPAHIAMRRRPAAASGSPPSEAGAASGGWVRHGLLARQAVALSTTNDDDAESRPRSAPAAAMSGSSRGRKER